MKTNKGFTLIELMIVVAIIGILSMIALPAYQIYTKKTYIAGGLYQFSSIKTAIIENHAVSGVAAARDFSDLGYSSSELYNNQSDHLRMASPLKYVKMESIQYNMIPEPVNRFTLVYDEKVGQQRNELVVEMYPMQLAADNTTVTRSNYKTVCVSYLKTRPNNAIPKEYLPARCVPSKNR